MGRREQMVEKVKELMNNQEKIRNMGIVAHIDHGKTTLSDNLIAGVGMISTELAGKQLFLDFDQEEQERGITINAANISMVYGREENKEDQYLINLIDTPGHVDFGGDVTRSMRAVDGALVVVCAVEGIMPQTETVLRQALRERVKPVLFINKVDRLINELQVTPEKMQEQFVKIIAKVNSLIDAMAPDEFKKEWQVRVEDGTVAFGSAYNNWAISLPMMKKTGMSFKDIYDGCKQEKQDELAKKIPLYRVVLEMALDKFPNPIEAQKYRIPKIWKGDLESEMGKSMISCDPNGKMVMMITKVIIDPHAGEIATGRIFSGKIGKGLEVKLITGNVDAKIQQVAVYMGPDRINVEDVPAGNIVALVGLRAATAGETICEVEIKPFEEMKHFSEPVITKAIEAKNTKDLPKLIEVLRGIQKQDTTIKVELDQETGEHLVAGMGELHLERIEHIIQRDHGLEITTSPPIVVYRESVTAKSKEIEGKSPNRHNKFYFYVEPITEEVMELLIEGEIPEGKIRGTTHVEPFVKAGMPRNEAKKLWAVSNNNIMVNASKGVQYLNETKELIIQGFEQAVNAGPIAKEKVQGVKVVLVDAVLHEDAIHRGPAQVIPAIWRPIHAGILTGKPIILEPKQKIQITVPQEFMGAATKEIQGRRGFIDNMEQDGDSISLIGKVPVAEMFGFAGDIRGATEGRVNWSIEYFGYTPLPRDLYLPVVKQIRERKGLDPNPPQAESIVDDDAE
ncbi:MAG: elongation factor EF-2 [Candidatus Diapherotrites archaeon]|nr:elongation factor EF-2 [Candidatus Diapherotrites archaeon]